jgi:hypothetical protein
MTAEVAGQYCLATAERSDSRDRCDCACDAGAVEAGAVEAGGESAADPAAADGGA